MRQNCMAVKREEFISKKSYASLFLCNSFWLVDSDTEKATLRCKVCLKAIANNGNSTTGLMQNPKEKHTAKWEKGCSVCNEQDWSGSLSTTTKSSRVSWKLSQNVHHVIGKELEESNQRYNCNVNCTKIWCAHIYIESAKVYSHLERTVIRGYVCTLFDQSWWKICFVHEGEKVFKCQKCFT